ncbi:MAG: hypothetical protein IPG39_20565 [Bacteroidetes bacterium]|nr:hypothetical protein [Bacteroidota bacterium]
MKKLLLFPECRNRILFGGGRNLDFETEKTTEFVLLPHQNTLDRLLSELVAPGLKLNIAHRWAESWDWDLPNHHPEKVNRYLLCP